MTTQSEPIVSLIDEFVVDEAYEFCAPKYYDFLSPEENESCSDSWFDFKIEDDITPEFYIEEEEQEEFEVEEDRCDASPTKPILCSPSSPSSRIVAIENRSPQRADDLMGRTVAAQSANQQRELGPSSPSTKLTSSLKYTTLSSPIKISNVAALQTQNRSESSKSNIKVTTATTITATKATATGSIKTTTTLTTKTTNTSAKSVTNKIIQTPQQTANANKISKKGLQVQTKPVSKTPANPFQTSRPEFKPLVNSNMTSNASDSKPSILSKPFASQRSLIVPIRKLGHTDSKNAVESAASRVPLKKPLDDRSRYLAPTQSQLAKINPTKPTKAPLKPIETNNPTTHRSKAYEKAAINYQSKVSVAKQKANLTSVHDKENLGYRPQSKYQVVKGDATPKPLAPVKAQKSTPNTLRLLRERSQKPLTVPTTPGFLKRRQLRLHKPEVQMTTEERIAAEAEKARREFWNQIRKKNEMRGLAPRVMHEAHLKPAQTARVGGWRP